MDPANCIGGRGMELCATNNLAVKYPEIAKQWDAEKNGALTPDKVLPSYTGKVWWKCENHPNHSWECAVNLRVRLHWGIYFSPVNNRLSLLQPSQIRRPESGCLVPRHGERLGSCRRCLDSLRTQKNLCNHTLFVRILDESPAGPISVWIWTLVRHCDS